MPAIIVRVLLRIAVPSAVLVAFVLVFHRLVPGRFGNLAETFLPWFGLIVPILLGLALWRRTLPTLLTALLPLVAWLVVFGGHLRPADDAAPTLVAVQHNVSDENPDPAATVRTLTAASPDLIGLEEITPEAYPAYAAAFGSAYPHHTMQGTVALWSRHPLSEALPLNIRPAVFGTDWNRGLRAVARTPHGEVAVYVVHLPSVRVGPGGLDGVHRDESARLLGAHLTTDPSARIVLLGDLNATVDDRGLKPVTAVLATAGSTFQFSWPAALPVARIDHVMAREFEVTRVWTLPRTGSDHLPLAAHLTLGGRA